MPSHKKIFHYWKDMCITKDGRVVHEKEKNNDDKYILIDYYEPCCWCCGKPVNFKKEYDKYEAILQSNDPDRVWDLSRVKSSLNRCHIIPHALGGSDDIDNLFLLCEDCHKESPDTIFCKYFFKYIYDNMSNSWFLKQIEDAKIIEDKVHELCNLYNKADITKLDIKDFTDKMRKQWVSHGRYIPHSTVVAIICENLPNKMNVENEDLESILTFC